MFELDPDEAIAERYFRFANDVPGLFAVGLSATSLQFSHPQPFAWFFLFVVVLCVFGGGKQYRNIAARYLKRYPGVIGGMVLVWRAKICIIGMLLLAAIALGDLTEPGIYEFFNLNSVAPN